MTDNIDTTPEAVEHLARKLMNLWAGGYGTTGKASNTIRALSVRIAELEAKLEKAASLVEFLDENYRHAFEDKAREKIRTVYAEIKGELP